MEEFAESYGGRYSERAEEAVRMFVDRGGAQRGKSRPPSFPPHAGGKRGAGRMRGGRGGFPRRGRVGLEESSQEVLGPSQYRDWLKLVSRDEIYVKLNQ